MSLSQQAQQVTLRGSVAAWGPFCYPVTDPGAALGFRLRFPSVSPRGHTSHLFYLPFWSGVKSTSRSHKRHFRSKSATVTTALTHEHSAHGSHTQVQCTRLSHMSTMHTALTHENNAHDSHMSTVHTALTHKYNAHGLSHMSTVHTALTHEYNAHGSHTRVQCTRL